MVFDRRTLLTDAGSLLLAGSIAPAAQAAPADLPRATPIGRVASISALASADPQLQCVDVLGYADAGDAGGGLFVWRPGAPARADTGVRIANERAKDGYWLRVAYEGGRVRPQWFGSFNTATDHAALIQAAIDFVAAEGAGCVDLGNETYQCQSRIVLNPTRCGLTGSGALLDFSHRAAAAENGAIVDLERLRAAATGSWSSPAEGLAHTPDRFTELTVPLALEAGQRYRATCKIDQLSGDPNNPFVRLLITCDGVDTPVVRLPTSAADRIAFDFEWPDKASTGRLSLTSNSQALITEFELRPLGTPECILVCADGGPQYGHLWLEGFRLKGPGEGSSASPLHGIRFETKRPAQSSRAAVRNLNVDGFETALVLADRAYLIHFNDSRFVGGVGVHFLHASQDAGENISFHGCTIGGGRIGLWNGGAEINLFGSSIDFAEQFYVGTGVLNAQSCHFETGRTTRADQYLFEIAEGSVTIDASYLMIGGGGFAAGNEADYIVYSRSPYAGFTIANTYCYNLRTRTGIFAGGDGRFESRNLSGIAMNPIAPVPKRDALSNLFGPASQLTGGAIGIDFRLVGGEQTGHLAVANGVLSVQARHDGEAGVLALDKTGDANAPLELWLLAPCHPRMKLGWSLDLGAERGAPQELSVGALFVQIIGREEHNVPRVGSVLRARQSDDKVEIKQADGWSCVQGSTFQTRYGDAYDGSAPNFATHVALRIDASALKRGDRLLIRAPYAGAY